MLRLYVVCMCKNDFLSSSEDLEENLENFQEFR
jgi:hypothetical protein